MTTYLKLTPARVNSLVNETFPDSDESLWNLNETEQIQAAAFARMHYTLYADDIIPEEQSEFFEDTLKLMWFTLSPQTQAWLKPQLDYGS